jgi:hypothetical protein
MHRMKTEIEKAEDPQGQADRLRYALFVVSGLDDIEEMKRVARAAMGGQLHGHEVPPPELPKVAYGPLTPLQR